LLTVALIVLTPLVLVPAFHDYNNSFYEWVNVNVTGNRIYDKGWEYHADVITTDPGCTARTPRKSTRQDLIDYLNLFIPLEHRCGC
jgi:hypothetical protein